LTYRAPPYGRGVRGRAMAAGTGACAQGGDLPTGPYQTRVHTEGQRQTQAAGHLNLEGSGLHDSSDAGAGADLRSRSSIGTLRLPSRAKRLTGGGRGGRVAVPRPPGSRGRRPRGLLREHPPCRAFEVGIAPDRRSARVASDQDVAGLSRGRNRPSRTEDGFRTAGLCRRAGTGRGAGVRKPRKEETAGGRCAVWRAARPVPEGAKRTV
jgi:hypothetical protein